MRHAPRGLYPRACALLCTYRSIPSCITQHYKPKTTGAPIYMLLGGADTYVGTRRARNMPRR